MVLGDESSFVPEKGEEEVIRVAKPKECDSFKFPERTHWSPFVLQGLSGDKFIRVVNKILNGEYVLLNTFPPDQENSEEILLEPKTQKFFG